MNLNDTKKGARLIGPDFLCIGAQKAGTGWLYEQLRLHPDFWMPPVKELHYFDRFWRSPRISAIEKQRGARKNARDERDMAFLSEFETLSGRSDIDLAGYASLFRSKDKLLSGDITPGYSTLPEEMIERIARHFAGLKVIFLARDPVERAWSQLSMWVRHGRLDEFDVNDLDQVTRHLSRPEVMLRSHPTRIVARWRRYVRPELFRIYFFDDLKREPTQLRGSIIEFLGGDPSKSSGDLPPDYDAKAKQERLELPGPTRAHVARFFETELRASAEELGGAAQDWPGRYGF
jgi:hypothetical protein